MVSFGFRAGEADRHRSIRIRASGLHVTAKFAAVVPQLRMLAEMTAQLAAVVLQFRMLAKVRLHFVHG